MQKYTVQQLKSGNRNEQGGQLDTTMLLHWCTLWLFLAAPLPCSFFLFLRLFVLSHFLLKSTWYTSLISFFVFISSLSLSLSLSLSRSLSLFFFFFFSFFVPHCCCSGPRRATGLGKARGSVVFQQKKKFPLTTAERLRAIWLCSSLVTLKTKEEKEKGWKPRICTRKKKDARQADKKK